ncbi:hypothetical protein C8Q75DRAFT_737818 [Abortiporus biennis]|nr:hypothetical protein C8Q75DRAFT_737818 [Abortiporus biennis]
MSESNTTETSSSSDLLSRSPHMQPDRALLQPIGLNDPNYTECIDGPLSPEWDSECEEEANDQTSPSSDQVSQNTRAQSALSWPLNPTDPDYAECIDGPLSPEQGGGYEEERKDVVYNLITSRRFGPDASSQSGTSSSKKPVTPVPNPQTQAQFQKATQITPAHPSLEALRSRDGEYKDSQFAFMVHREYPFVDFVRTVWDYKKYIPAGDYSIPMEYMTGYSDAVPDDQKLVGEPASCIWLNKILLHLHNKLPGNPFYSGQFVNIHDRVVKGQYAKYKPDGSYNEETDEKKQVWDAMAACNEVKHSVKITSFKDRDKQRVFIDISLLNTMLETEDYDNPSGEIAPLKRKRSKVAVSGQSTELKRSRSNTGPTGLRLSRSRTTSSGNLGKSGELSSTWTMSPQIPTVSVVMKSKQSSILFDHEFMSLWCIDRMGVVKSQEINFLTHPHYLLLTIAALKSASLAQLDVCPFLDYSDPRARFGKYDHVYLQLPRAVDEHGREITDKDQLRFPLDVEPPQRDIQTTYGAIGRGTTVIPLKGASSTSDKTLIAKISWPAERRTPEDTFVRVIRTKLKADKNGQKYVQNIPVVKYSLSLNRDDKDLAFPRGSMEIFREHVSAHYYVYTVAGILHRDVSITNLMFLRVGNTVIGILLDWDLAVGASPKEQKEEVLQLRGIKLEGAVAVKSDSGPHSHGAKLLSSMEAAPAARQPQTEDKWASMRFKTGTPPFMALELLKTTPPPLHLYRYDLESFFYVLVWFCATFDPKTSTMGEISKWQLSDVSIWESKIKFLQAEDELLDVMAKAGPRYQFLITEWIRPLGEVFGEIFSLSNQIFSSKERIKGRAKAPQDRRKGVQLDDPTELESKLDRLATYENFMLQLED